jgi:hypothetical protein
MLMKTPLFIYTSNTEWLNCNLLFLVIFTQGQQIKSPVEGYLWKK